MNLEHAYRLASALILPDPIIRIGRGTLHRWKVVLDAGGTLLAEEANTPEVALDLIIAKLTADARAKLQNHEEEAERFRRALAPPEGSTER